MSNGDTSIKSNNGDNMGVFKKDGAVELYYDNNKVCETIAAGIRVQRLTATSTYIELQNSGGVAGYLYGESNNQIQLMDREGHAFLKGIKDGAVELYYDNAKKLQTGNGGLDFFGRSVDCDLKLKTSDGTTRGSVYAYNDNSIAFLNAAGSYSFKVQNDKAAVFYGHALPQQNNSYDLGSTALRWRNIYTNDLNLSNEGSANDVDGTWGDWTIQEGESDLFLKNNRSGKKYKFNLAEVS